MEDEIRTSPGAESDLLELDKDRDQEVVVGREELDVFGRQTSLLQRLRACNEKPVSVMSDLALSH